MKDTRKHCPVHGAAGSEIVAWGNCPTGEEGDPPEREACPHYATEIRRRFLDVTDRGNYYSVLNTEGGILMVQEYRNHEKYGGPKPA